MQFSDTTNRTGIIELLEDLTTTQSATDSSYPLATKVRDVNNAFSYYMSLAIKACGRWQVDDTNQTDYPIVTFDLVSGQDNYAFDRDGSTPTNQMIELHKLRIKDANGKWIDIEQIDRREFDINQFQDITGVPEYYDITSNGVIFYPTPNYNSDEGAELYVSRMPTRFTSSDTTKKAGIPEMFHEYLAIRPAYFYCLVNGLKQATGLGNEMLRIEANIKNYYAGRNRGERSVVTSEPIFSI